jgi:hypothetical protein
LIGLGAHISNTWNLLSTKGQVVNEDYIQYRIDIGDPLSKSAQKDKNLKKDPKLKSYVIKSAKHFVTTLYKRNKVRYLWPCFTGDVETKKEPCSPVKKPRMYVQVNKYSTVLGFYLKVVMERNLEKDPMVPLGKGINGITAIKLPFSEVELSPPERKWISLSWQLRNHILERKLNMAFVFFGDDQEYVVANEPDVFCAMVVGETYHEFIQQFNDTAYRVKFFDYFIKNTEFYDIDTSRHDFTITDFEYQCVVDMMVSLAPPGYERLAKFFGDNMTFYMNLYGFQVGIAGPVASGQPGTTDIDSMVCWLRAEMAISSLLEDGDDVTVPNMIDYWVKYGITIKDSDKSKIPRTALTSEFLSHIPYETIGYCGDEQIPGYGNTLITSRLVSSYVNSRTFDKSTTEGVLSAAGAALGRLIEAIGNNHFDINILYKYASDCFRLVFSRKLFQNFDDVLFYASDDPFMVAVLKEMKPDFTQSTDFEFPDLSYFRFLKTGLYDTPVLTANVVEDDIYITTTKLRTSYAPRPGPDKPAHVATGSYNASKNTKKKNKAKHPPKITGKIKPKQKSSSKKKSVSSGSKTTRKKISSNQLAEKKKKTTLPKNQKKSIPRSSLLDRHKRRHQVSTDSNARSYGRLYKRDLTEEKLDSLFDSFYNSASESLAKSFTAKYNIKNKSIKRVKRVISDEDYKDFINIIAGRVTEPRMSRFLKMSASSQKILLSIYYWNDDERKIRDTLSYVSEFLEW